MFIFSHSAKSINQEFTVNIIKPPGIHRTNAQSANSLCGALEKSSEQAGMITISCQDIDRQLVDARATFSTQTGSTTNKVDRRIVYKK